MKILKNFNRTLLLILILSPLHINAQMIYNQCSSGTVSLDMTIQESKVEKAVPTAQIQSIFQVLFRGVPGTNVETPLLTTNEDEWFNAFPEYFERLLNEKNGRYPSFIVSSVLLSKGKNEDKKKYVSLRICVNVNALNHDLENHGIKRRFGL